MGDRRSAHLTSPVFSKQPISPGRILAWKRRLGFLAIIDGQVVSPVVVGRVQHGAQVQGYVGIWITQRDADCR